MLLLVLAVVFSLTGVRALQFQVFEASGKADEAIKNMTITKQIDPVRGAIYDRDGRTLAFTEATVDLVAYPNLIALNGRTADEATDDDRAFGQRLPEVMAPLITQHVPAEQLAVPDVRAALADPNKKYVRLAKQVSIGVYNAIVADLAKAKSNQAKNGLAWTLSQEADPVRVYPMRTVASNVLGYMSSGKGSAGLELSYNAQLAGTPGQQIYETSRNGPIPLGNSTLTPAVNGTNLTTTLDSTMCWNAQRLMDARRSEIKAEWGFTVIMEVKTGKVLCLANTPSFDGNDPGASDISALNDPAMMYPYEPGSTMKLLSLAALMDASGETAHPVTPDTLTYVDSQQNGIKSGEHTIRDSEKHPAEQMTTRGILVNSSNQGVIQLTRNVFGARGSAGKQQYADYLTSFGLGKKTGIGVPGETAGLLPGDKIVKDTYTIDSVAFGTSLTVNAVQMAAAVNSVVNDGVYIAPSLIAATSDADGVLTKSPAPATHRVIKSTTSRQVRSMMENRVLDSYSTIGIPGYRTGAKTGTARMGKNDLIMSIAGVAPIDDPQLLVYTCYFQKDSQAGAGISAAGPVYQNIMALALQRYGILPSPDAAQHCVQEKLTATDTPTNKCPVSKKNP